MSELFGRGRWELGNWLIWEIHHQVSHLFAGGGIEEFVVRGTHTLGVFVMRAIHHVVRRLSARGGVGNVLFGK